MSTITTRYGTELYYKDWGEGPVVTFRSGAAVFAFATNQPILHQAFVRIVADIQAGVGGPVDISRQRQGTDQGSSLVRQLLPNPTVVISTDRMAGT